jgi:phospholipase C
MDSTTTSAQAAPSISHDWGPQHSAWNNGAMDNWVPAHIAADGGNGPFTMGHYTREDIPVHFALARADPLWVVCLWWSQAIDWAPDWMLCVPRDPRQG